MLKKLLAITIPFLFFGPAAYAGGDVEAGKVIFENICSECHYEDDFAGETKEDILALVKGVAGGEVEHKGDLSSLNEEDLKNIAAYYASFE